ncbi:uncharacterized protein LOC120164629 [Hibiscus syriacus]|uniref:uncharacterized protein LOC120164629 n=1 Tax=Hibiscus syriacus TaxID=106335 RepID=UPI001922ABAA|nr:uncharacterized protein LOC120164629 [Hibiscus syriacus]
MGLLNKTSNESILMYETAALVSSGNGLNPLFVSPEPTEKPLSLLFEETVGLTEKVGERESQSQDENNRLMSKSRELDREVGEFKPEKEAEEKVEGDIPWKVNSLVGLFGGERKEEKVKRIVKPRRESGEVTALKDLSVFVEAFVRYLFSIGYFHKANFLEDNKLDFGHFDNNYARGFIKFSAYEFAKDHQEIAKWLSGTRLKKVAAFGCPSLDKTNVFAAKRLRKIFKIQEGTVCSRCVLKDSCRYANEGVWGITTKSLLLVDVMKVIILYALDQVHPEAQSSGGSTGFNQQTAGGGYKAKSNIMTEASKMYLRVLGVNSAVTYSLSFWLLTSIRFGSLLQDMDMIARNADKVLLVESMISLSQLVLHSDIHPTDDSHFSGNYKP